MSRYTGPFCGQCYSRKPLLAADTRTDDPVAEESLEDECLADDSFGTGWSLEDKLGCSTDGGPRIFDSCCAFRLNELRGVVQ